SFALIVISGIVFSLCSEQLELSRAPAFEREEEALGRHAPCSAIAAERAVGSNDPMAGYDNRDGIAAAGASDGARRGAELGGDGAVGTHGSVGDRQHRLPDGLPESRAGENERQVEAPQPTSEIGFELGARLLEERR